MSALLRAALLLATLALLGASAHATEKLKPRPSSCR